MSPCPHPRPGPRRARGWALAGSCLLLGACSINPHVELDTVAAASEPIELQSVPFFPQSEYQCGPAALAGILGAAGIPVTADELTPQVYLPGRQGSLQIELMAATRRAGLLAYPVEPDLAALVAEVESGRPVLVLQNLRTRHFPVWHYAVLVGLDPPGNAVILNTGTEAGKRVPAPTFLRTWDWAGRWGLLALRPGELPVRADPLGFAHSVAALERVAGADTALPAWQAAISRWPDDYRMHLALGNTLYALGQAEDAMQQYRRGLAIQPGQAVLENNHASVLAGLGCPRQAERRLQALSTRLGPDSPWRAELQQTLEELRGQAGQDDPSCGHYAGQAPATDPEPVAEAQP